MKAIGTNKTILPTKYKLLWFSPILIIAFIVKFPDWRKTWLLSNYGKETVAKIELVTLSGLRSEFDDKNVLFIFSADGKMVRGFESAPVNQTCVFTPFGLTVEPEQKYIVRYYPDDPEINQIYLDKPLAENMLQYLTDVADRLAYTPEFADAPPLTRFCLAISIFRQFHFDGWANIMFFDEYLLENLSHNGFSYRSMINSDEFKKVRNNCNL